MRMHHLKDNYFIIYLLPQEGKTLNHHHHHSQNQMVLGGIEEGTKVVGGGTHTRPPNEILFLTKEGSQMSKKGHLGWLKR